MFLKDLATPVGRLKGVGPRAAESLANLGIVDAAALLVHYPRDWEDRSLRVSLAEFARAPKVNTVVTLVAKDYIGYGRNRTLKLIVTDGTANASLVCFGRNFLERSVKPDQRYFLSGAFQFRYGEIQATAFELESVDGEAERFTGILPVYPLTANLQQGQLRRIMKQAVAEYARFLDDELPDDLRERYRLLHKAAAITAIHFPPDAASLEDARRTLIYEELFFLQLGAALRVSERAASAVERPALKDGLLARLLDRLPFGLTPDQQAAVGDLKADMSSPVPMARLLQGEVGSGKTLVAFLACLLAIENGGQAAIMAPTELLARQHAENAAKLLEPIGVRLAFLTGNVKDAGRAPLLAALRAGDIDLIIGTHALFSADVAYRNLRLIVIDEQHRFGVAQRQALTGKGRLPDLLMMTATPIPRTLALTAFGDLSITTIRTMPKGRKPVITHLARSMNERKVYEFIRQELGRGRQAYFVYPLIEQSEKSDLKDAEGMAERLAREVYPEYPVALIHSRLPDEEKREAMAAFTKGTVKVLVATSVVEVGVDVPNATCMVVEHAERFGLSALHQLRGRVGRGTEQSYCFLVYSDKLTEDGKERLKVMLENADGFAIAEEDLRIRGPGELAGTAQSGFLRLNIADPVRDEAVLVRAREDAFTLVRDDPGLTAPSHARLRDLVRQTSG